MSNSASAETSGVQQPKPNAAPIKWIPMIIWLGIPAILLMLPPPEGLSPQAWKLAAFYLCASLGLIFRPLPDPVILLTVLGLYTLSTPGGSRFVMAGYSNGTTWLVFCAFLVGRTFIETGLGNRVAYFLIDKFGNTSLKLGYIAATTDLVISPSTPSFTARTGGLVSPIFRSLAVTLGSEPGATSRRIGGYLILLLNYVGPATGTLFLTSNATNPLAFRLAKDVTGVGDISWGTYALGALPGVAIMLLLGPWLVYKLYPPTLKKIDNKVVAKEGLAKLGPMTRNEKVLTLFFLSALTLWSTSHLTRVETAPVAIVFIAALLLFRVISWETLLTEKGAWGTLIWYGGIIGLSNGLSHHGFFKWMGALVQKNFALASMDPIMFVCLLIFISLPLHYLIPSIAAFTSTMVPVYAILGQAAGAPPMFTAMAVCCTLSIAAVPTHFSHAASPILFGMGYVDVKTWWLMGLLMMLLGTTVMLGTGIFWWPVIGIY